MARWICGAGDSWRVAGGRRLCESGADELWWGCGGKAGGHDRRRVVNGGDGTRAASVLPVDEERGGGGRLLGREHNDADVAGHVRQAVELAHVEHHGALVVRAVRTIGALELLVARVVERYTQRSTRTPNKEAKQNKHYN